MKFQNELEPTEDELREWASNPDAEYPEGMNQDWDLILANIESISTLIKLSCEPSPNREFFLSCLYIVSGSCVRFKIDEQSITEIRSNFCIIPDDAPGDVKLWAKRSDTLFNEPDSYTYEGWGWGDLAYEAEQ